MYWVPSHDFRYLEIIWAGLWDPMPGYRVPHDQRKITVRDVLSNHLGPGNYFSVPGNFSIRCKQSYSIAAYAAICIFPFHKTVVKMALPQRRTYGHFKHYFFIIGVEISKTICKQNLIGLTKTFCKNMLLFFSI